MDRPWILHPTITSLLCYSLPWPPSLGSFPLTSQAPAAVCQAALANYTSHRNHTHSHGLSAILLHYSCSGNLQSRSMILVEQSYIKSRYNNWGKLQTRSAITVMKKYSGNILKCFSIFISGHPARSLSFPELVSGNLPSPIKPWWMLPCQCSQLFEQRLAPIPPFPDAVLRALGHIWF